MPGSNALTVSLATVVISLSLSSLPADSIVPSFSCCNESDFQTTSLNTVAEEYGKNNLDPRGDALALFGVQSNYSPEEQITYKAMLRANSKSIGKNIFDLFQQ